MPRELPGFYYDPEKNRYFPIKGPIPGAASHSSSNAAAALKANDQHNSHNRKGIGTAELLQVRELCGNPLSFKRRPYNFQHEFQKIQASQSMVWRYRGMDRIVDSALENFHSNIQTSEGLHNIDFLLMGSMRGTLSLYVVGDEGKHFDYGVKCTPERIYPQIRALRAECSTMPVNIWRPTEPIVLPTISCIKTNGKHSHTADGGSAIQHALITTLGSEISGGSVYIMSLNEPLDFSRTERISKVAALGCTIWTADCNHNGCQAVIGTNLGVSLVNLETQKVSWLCRSKSDVLSLQFDQSGNVVLCGYRNGAIVTVDVRQKQGFADRLPRHQVPCSSHFRNGRYQDKTWFELKANITPSATICMPSSVSSLLSLETYDQYFLASSMDGSMKLYDHRVTQRGAVQSYQGQVNSHTRIQLGVDSSEKFIISGGEDGKIRIWCIKTGELLFGAKVANSAPTSVCSPPTYQDKHSWGAWLGSAEGLFYIHAS